MTHKTPASTFRSRARQVHEKLGATVALLCAGHPRSRNYRAWTYPFRASSHFLYLTGLQIPGAVLLLKDGQSKVFVPRPDDDDPLWHGTLPTLDELRAVSGADSVQYLDELGSVLPSSPARSDIATLAPQEHVTAAWLSSILGRTIEANSAANIADSSPDARLADAMIAVRLCHDSDAIAQMKEAATFTTLAHRAGVEATTANDRAHVVRAAMQAVVQRFGSEFAYGPIVSPHGEILHNESSAAVMNDGDLLLADVGAESSEGWACDVTRTWPVSGKLSTTQREIYQVVLNAQRKAISLVKPGVGYRTIHHAARRTIVAGLVELGIFTGDVDDLDQRGAGELFFPHGIGHLLGLDVHDIEDLGDRAGYARGRVRSSRFGEAYLRLDRDLAPGMIVTIEPGFYQVPAILSRESLVKPLESNFNRQVLAKYRDVRGIRLEDDILVTESGFENLTAAIPIDPLTNRVFRAFRRTS